MPGHFIGGRWDGPLGKTSECPDRRCRASRAIRGGRRRRRAAGGLHPDRRDHLAGTGLVHTGPVLVAPGARIASARLVADRPVDGVRLSDHAGALVDLEFPGFT
jgi:hypothetical protein